MAPTVTSVTLNPSSVTGGKCTSGTVTLSGAAPAGGAVVTLSHDKPVVSGIEGVSSAAGLPAGGVVDWSSLGGVYSSISSGTIVPVTGQAGVNMTLSTGTGLDMMLLTNCAAGGNCAWYGNFADGANLLWMNGTYDGSTGWWAPHGPLTVDFSSPQRGVGFQIMADENGAFQATLCAYNSAAALLGCVPFTGNASSTADNTAIFMGVYDDAQEIARVTIDAGGLLYPHDFAIGQMLVTGTRRSMMPASVTVPAGASSTTFPVSTNAVGTVTAVNITGTYATSAKSGALTINPAVLASVSLNPSNVIGGSSSTGTATLTGPAPAGGVVVTLTADNAVSSGLQSVTSAIGVPKDGTVNWSQLGPVFTSIPSGTTVPIAGLPGVTVSVATANDDLSAMILANCPTVDGACAFWGNFAPAEPLLWVGGVYDGLTGSWTGNGPLILTLSAPQRGLAFRIMADEGGPFTGTICAYDAADEPLGCAPINGTGAPIAGGSNGIAAYVGVYNDAQQISRVIIDAGGALYPHDFAIGSLTVASSRRMVPPSVTVQPGASTTTFPVNTDTVTAHTSVAVTGTYSGTHASTLSIDPALSGLSISPSSVDGGWPTTGTVTLAIPAPAGGAVVVLSSNNTAAIVPTSITVPAGQTAASFTITTRGVAVPTPATIVIAYAGATKTASLTIIPALASISMSPATVVGSVSSTGTVTMTNPAPTGGAVVALSSNNTAAIVPTSITVPAGQTTASFTITTSGVGAWTSATISGTYVGATQTASLAIAPALASISMNPATVVGGLSSTGTVTLINPAPVGGAVVTLSDNSAFASTPASVTIPEGATAATFPITTVAVGTSASATISASLIASTLTANLTISAPILSSVTMSPSSVIGGSSSVGTVTLSSAAPAGGAVVTLSDNSLAALTPDNVTVLAGATTATFVVTTQQVGPITPVTITGTYNGTANGSLTINPPNPIRVNAGGTAFTDSLGHLWSADSGFTGGSTGSVPAGTAIAATVDDTLYQSERYGSSFTYSFTVPAGSYQVTMKFAETFFTNDVDSGQRTFNVVINGTTVLTNFDVKATAGGANIALDRVFAVTTGAGANNIQIQFVHLSGQADLPMVKAIEVVGAL